MSEQGRRRKSRASSRNREGSKVIGRTRFLVRAALALLTGAASMTMAAAQTTSSLRALLVQYRCPVVDRLDRIYEHRSPRDHLDRFLAVTLIGHPHGYVQCMFVENRTKLLCEASSGYYFDKKDAPRKFFQPPGSIAALGALGFSTDDSEGNFRYEADLGQTADLNAIADLILSALHDGYGARVNSELKFNAPFAPRATSKCIPMS
jgi:hypothetical protein